MYTAIRLTKQAATSSATTLANASQKHDNDGAGSLVDRFINHLDEKVALANHEVAESKRRRAGRGMDGKKKVLIDVGLTGRIRRTKNLGTMLRFQKPLILSMKKTKGAKKKEGKKQQGSAVKGGSPLPQGGNATPKFASPSDDVVKTQKKATRSNTAQRRQRRKTSANTASMSAAANALAVSQLRQADSLDLQRIAALLAKTRSEFQANCGPISTLIGAHVAIVGTEKPLGKGHLLSQAAKTLAKHDQALQQQDRAVDKELRPQIVSSLLSRLMGDGTPCDDDCPELTVFTKGIIVSQSKERVGVISCVEVNVDEGSTTQRRKRELGKRKRGEPADGANKAKRSEGVSEVAAQLGNDDDDDMMFFEDTVAAPTPSVDCKPENDEAAKEDVDTQTNCAGHAALPVWMRDPLNINKKLRFTFTNIAKTIEWKHHEGGKKKKKAHPLLNSTTQQSAPCLYAVVIGQGGDDEGRRKERLVGAVQL